MSSLLKKVLILQTNMPTGTLNCLKKICPQDTLPVLEREISSYDKFCSHPVYRHSGNLIVVTNRVENLDLIKVKIIDYTGNNELKFDYVSINPDWKDLDKSLIDFMACYNSSGQDVKSKLVIDNKDYYKFLYEQINTQTTLTDEEMKELCYEFFDLFACKTSKIRPQVRITKSFNGFNVHSSYNKYLKLKLFYWNELKNEIGCYFPHKGEIPSDPFWVHRRFINVFESIGGIAGFLNDLDVVYILNKKLAKLKNPENIKFWKWYEKTLNVLAIRYEIDTNTFYVMPKPDELKIDNKVVYCCFGDEESCYYHNTQIPVELYLTPAEELDPNDYLKIRNADVKAFFLEKIGIACMAETGKILDSWENYPENEMWKKSEYKLIDMSHLGIPKTVTRWGSVLKKADYAPYLLMKNQTTGGYHLEGVSPNCKNLVDAVKMRYSLEDEDLNHICIMNIK